MRINFRSKIDTFTESPTDFLMDNFRTELNILRQEPALGLKDSFLTMGSCFAHALGTRLEQFKFTALTNPFGTTYNPVSIHRQLSWALTNELPAEKSYATDGELFFNYHLHSQFSSPEKSELESRIEKTIQHSNSFLKRATCILITYGTSWVYEWKEDNGIVANCHKQPASLFEKRLLSQIEIEESFAHVYKIIREKNPHVKIILTVSPVRHIKDTLPLNMVSKSILRMACHAITRQFKNVEYFPAYEIMIDDLRDYRFYKQDRIHPTEEAEDYIWRKFCQSHFDATTLHFIETWKEIQVALAHKPFHPYSHKHQQFLKELLVRLEKLKSTVPIQNEIDQVVKQIHS